jgi:hypothetical protein
LAYPFSEINPTHAMEDQDFALVFVIIFLAISSATTRSERGIIGLLLHPGREEIALRAPGSHRVTG